MPLNYLDDFRLRVRCRWSRGHDFPRGPESNQADRYLETRLSFVAIMVTVVAAR